jgi:hypothetical protein
MHCKGCSSLFSCLAVPCPLQRGMYPRRRREPTLPPSVKGILKPVLCARLSLQLKESGLRLAFVSDVLLMRLFVKP